MEEHHLTLEDWKRPLSTTQVADALSVSPRTVINWIEEGRIPGRRVGRNWKVPRVIVRLFLADPVSSLSETSET